MYDIDYYMNHIRTESPIVWNIETTNACNMRCKMCPRTTLMTRPVTTMNPEQVEQIISQLKPISTEKWAIWLRFVQDKYGISQNEMSENHFFLYVLPWVVQLHGHGEPVLDKNIAKYVKMLTLRGVGSYFSCNPANINLDQMTELFRNGLDYIKFSIESLDDSVQQSIRGIRSSFDLSKIFEVLDMRKRNGFTTEVVITMIDLNRETQQEDWVELKRRFNGQDVYIYLKSENSQWYREDRHINRSIHWSEPCKHPWMSMSINSDGKVVSCPSDYNNEVVLGDANTQDLYSIWNGSAYKKFRYDHLQATNGIRCTDHCDMRVMGAA